MAINSCNAGGMINPLNTTLSPNRYKWRYLGRWTVARAVYDS